MTKLTPVQARVLRKLHDNAGVIRWSDLLPSERSSATSMEKKGLCQWLYDLPAEDRKSLRITAKGIEALKGPIDA